ncbi:ice-binding family protein [Streptomyces sp. NPDC014636]|uniref:ice-binding family protein n=1 Tax=Streptomyces sp. NPDC014636 TaxID=3364876 RepID=UPI0036FFC273
MTLNIPVAPLRRTLSVWTAAALAVVISAVVVAVTPTEARALATFVDLGRADSFAVLAGSATTNTGPSVITGDVGVSPGTSISGYGPPAVVNGTLHSADTVAQDAQTDLTAAYDDAAGQPSDGALPPDAGDLTLVPGVYTASSTLGLTGTLTLDAQENPNAVWVFQIGSGLTTASSSRVSLINGASPCNVFWKVGSSATLGTNTDFAGNILAMTSITVTTGATIEGRALARNGAVTLDTNTITRPECAGGTSGGSTTTTGGPTTTTTGGPAGPTTTTGGPAGPTTTTTGGPAGPTTTTGGPAGPTTGGPAGPTTTTGGPAGPTTTTGGPAGPTTTTTGGPAGPTTTTGGPAGPTTTTGGPAGPTTTTGGPAGPTTTTGGPAGPTTTTGGPAGPTTGGPAGPTTTTGGPAGPTTGGPAGPTTTGGPSTTGGPGGTSTSGGSNGGNGHGCKPDEHPEYGDKPEKPGKDDDYGCDPA